MKRSLRTRFRYSAVSVVAACLSLSALPAGCKKTPEEPKEAASAEAVSEPEPEAPKAAASITKPEQPSAPPAPADVAQAPKDAKKTTSGLASKVLAEGSGKKRAGPSDRVSVHYTGWTTDGKMFDSSIPRGKPSEFGVGQVIAGWTEGLQLMVEGEKRRFWIPAKLAYGDKPRAGAPAGDLVFDVELLEIQAMPEPPQVPTDVKAPPKDSTKTKSGLAYRVLTKGTGTRHPTAEDRVSVHYTGWTPDGKMFDSSITTGRPATFPLNRVIPGWTEGVQLMVEGEKTRFWIPAGLAYGEKPQRPGAPAGPLVFDVELFDIL